MTRGILYMLYALFICLYAVALNITTTSSRDAFLIQVLKECMLVPSSHLLKLIRCCPKVLSPAQHEGAGKA